MTRFLAILFLLFVAAPAFAQTEEEDRGYFTELLEQQLSTPNQQIRISGISGALSSDATIGEISIADREGVWLRIVNARIDWTRRSLLLGRLQIASLGAERIEVLRKPLPEEAVTPESTPFALPELPVSVNIDALNVQRIVFGPTVFGLASELSLTGRLRLADGSLDTQLEVQRLDGPGGQLALTATYANETRVLGLDFRLSEPANGIVANLLSIEGRPPVGLVVAGQGPLDQLDVSLTLDAAGERILTGRLALRQAIDGIGFNTTVDGPIANLIPERFRSFFGRTTTLVAEGVSKEAGGFRLDRLDLRSAALTLAGSAETAADGFLQRLDLDGSVANPAGGGPVLLPVPGQNTLDRVDLSVDYGVSGDGAWRADLDIAGLRTESFAAETLVLDLIGVAQNLNDPAARRVTFNADGDIGGITASSPEVAEALGRAIQLDVLGEWASGQPVRLERATVAGNGLNLALDGTIAEATFNGNIALNARSLVPFSALAGRDLTGAIDLTARGSVLPVSGGFDLDLNGTANGLTIDQEQADALLAGETRLSGGIARGEQGLVTRNFRIENPQVQLNADGRFATGAADFDFDLALADLGLVSENSAGRATANGSATGQDGAIRLNFDAAVPSGRLMGRTLTQAQIGFDGVQLPDLLDGNVTGTAFLDGNRVQLASGISVSDTRQRLTGLDFQAGGARLTGDLDRLIASGLLDGRVVVDATDISTAAALALQQATGAVDATVNLRPVEGRQDGDVTATIRAFRLGETQIEQADIEAAFSDLFNVPGGNARITASGIAAGGVNVTQLRAEARQNADVTDFNASASLDNGTDATVAGALARIQSGFRVTLQELAVAQGQLAARLIEPSALTVEGSNVTIDGLALDVGGGRVNAEGRIAETIDLDVAIAALPLSIANTIRPDLELGGTIDGTVTVTGHRAQPDVNFDLRGNQLAAAALRQAGLSTLDVAANGRTQGQALTLDATLTSPEGLNARAAGTVPLGEGELGLDVTINAFPLAVLNAVAPGQDLAGSISGSARVTGELADPAATFELQGSGISAAPLAENGLAPLQATAAGSFANQTLSLQSTTVNGPQGLTLSASGQVPLSGGGLSVNLDGEAPLALGNRFLADRGTQLSGTLVLNASVTGSIQQPVVQGRITSAGASVIDPETNLRINDIAVAIGLTADTVTIENVSGSIAGGGRVGASGTVSIAGDGFPADIAISLDNARYADGELVVATVNGRITITGPLTRDPLIAGTVDVARAEITIPESFAGGAAAIDVRHVNPPRGVAVTLERARANDGTPTPEARPSVARLDVTINATNQVFVRGRGLDAELGGQVRITGPVTNIQPVGGLELIRGRIGILGRRITFDEGEVTLVGDLDPFVNLVARSEGTDITVFVTVSGRVSDIDITFSAEPALPQDEVLARLIFDRGINDLSPFQIAQLAAAAAELAGGSGGNSLLANLRAGTGLDDLDVVTDSEGNAAVRAGRYIQENIYLGVEAGAGGNASATINLDVTDNLKVKGAAGTRDSSLGVFYERDY